jgi:hypothetical protein
MTMTTAQQVIQATGELKLERTWMKEERLRASVLEMRMTAGT